MTTQYKWLVDGKPIAGETAATYAVRPADVGKAISLQVLGKRVGYNDAVVVSNALTAVAGDALLPTVAPFLSGTARLGERLAANPGVWPDNPRLAYQWLRDGRVIGGANGATYQVVYADVQRRISVRVTGHRDGYQDGVKTTHARLVPKVRSRTVGTMLLPKVRRKGHGKVSVTVTTAPGAPAATGPIAVYDGTHRKLTVTLKTRKLGRIVIRLPRLKKGKHRITVRYLGNTRMAASTSRRMALRVTR